MNVSKDKVTLINQSELDSLIGKAVHKALKNNNKKWENRLIEERQVFQLEQEQFLQRERIVMIKEHLLDAHLPLTFAEILVSIPKQEGAIEMVNRIKKTWDEEITKARININ